jgi:hypothetical protein
MLWGFANGFVLIKGGVPIDLMGEKNQLFFSESFSPFINNLGFIALWLIAIMHKARLKLLLFCSGGMFKSSKRIPEGIHFVGFSY